MFRQLLALLAASPALAQTLTLHSPLVGNVGLFGDAISGIADLNGDGRGELIVGAWNEDSLGVVSAGQVYICSGANGTVIRTLYSPGREMAGGFAFAVSAIPDVNGDGKADILSGAPFEDPGFSPTDCGRAYIHSGATGALLFKLLPPAAQADGNFGVSVAGIGDLNGDGRGDCVVGAPREDLMFTPDAGRVHVYSGATGLRVRTLVSPPAYQHPSEFFGAAVAALADITGDGVPDIAVGAPETDTVTVIGPGHVYLFSGASGAFVRRIQSPVNQQGGGFGGALSAVPDTDGDGVGDLVVGAPFEHPGASPPSCGRAHVYSGRTGQLLRKLLPPTPQADGHFGISVAGIADLNGDARGDIIIGANQENLAGAPAGCGRAHVYSGLTGLRLFSFAPFIPEGDGNFGAAVTAIPDTNANNRADFGVGATGELSFDGQAYIIRN